MTNRALSLERKEDVVAGKRIVHNRVSLLSKVMARLRGTPAAETSVAQRGGKGSDVQAKPLDSGGYNLTSPTPSPSPRRVEDFGEVDVSKPQPPENPLRILFSSPEVAKPSLSARTVSVGSDGEAERVPSVAVTRPPSTH